QEDVYLKHFYDSISAAFYMDFTKPLSLCDVGAGAGFPSIPLKICFPHIEVTIVDSLNKRIQFLNHLSEALGLDKVFFVHSRA
ncbi:RsmG family class I SAM-dependent methyltransferase, partial [Streptococcus pneumoniae]|nr:RsmG family class I SAM-dependent methyltransferase [Streptococcus pneumoniae]